MGSVYRIYQPSGVVWKANLDDDRAAVVSGLIDRWSSYCERNWLNGSSDPFNPETKVKFFLDSMGYYLLVGQSQDIVSSYKRIMNDKREIPISSCPSFVQNMTDGSGGASAEVDNDERFRFKILTEDLDIRASGYERKKAARKKKETRLAKIMRIGLRSAKRCRVDTDGAFEYEGCRYALSDRLECYKPKETAEGLLYDMDAVLACGGKFYTETGDEIADDMISEVQ